MPFHDDLAASVPRKPRSRHSFDENLDEPRKVIEQEPADVQTETPDEGNSSVEQTGEEEKSSQGVEDNDTDNG